MFSKIMSRQLLHICKDGDSTIFLGNLCHCLVTLTADKGFHGVQREPPAFRFGTIASGPAIRHHWVPSSSHPLFKSVYVYWWENLGLQCFGRIENGIYLQKCNCIILLITVSFRCFITPIVYNLLRINIHFDEGTSCKLLFLFWFFSPSGFFLIKEDK